MHVSSGMVTLVRMSSMKCVQKNGGKRKESARTRSPLPSAPLCQGDARYPLDVGPECAESSERLDAQPSLWLLGSPVELGGN